MINIRPLTDAIVDALMDANQIDCLAQFIEDASANKAYEIGNKLTGDLSLAMIFCSDALRLYYINQAFPSDDLENRFNYEARRAIDCFKRLNAS